MLDVFRASSVQLRRSKSVLHHAALGNILFGCEALSATNQSLPQNVMRLSTKETQPLLLRQKSLEITSREGVAVPDMSYAVLPSIKLAAYVRERMIGRGYRPDSSPQLR